MKNVDKKMYIGIWHDGSDFLMPTPVRPLEKHKTEGIKPKYTYYELDFKKGLLIEVDLILLAQNH